MVKMEFISIFTQVLTRPKVFFKSVEYEEEYLKPWLYFMVVILIYFSLSTIVSLPGAAISIVTQGDMGFGLLFFFLFMGIWFTVMIILSAMGIFILAAIMHLFLMIVGASKGYHHTFKMICYSAGPLVFLAPLAFIKIIPLLGSMVFFGLLVITTIVIMIYEVIGATILHKITMARAVIGVVVIPMILATMMFILSAIFIMGLVALIYNSGGVTGMVASSVI